VDRQSAGFIGMSHSESAENPRHCATGRIQTGARPLRAAAGGIDLDREADPQIAPRRRLANIKNRRSQSAAFRIHHGYPILGFPLPIRPHYPHM